jgi:ABC-type branched-subunit amino acid transport system ATPase component
VNDSPVLLAARDLSVRFGGVLAVNKISFDVRRGEVFTLIGPNGAGKTTIFNLITGHYAVDAGTVAFRDRRIDGLNPRAVFDLGIARTFQDLKLFGGMTVLENALVGRERGVRSWREVDANVASARETLTKFGLDRKLDVLARDLSYAEQKFLSLARALSCRSELLLLDEPTSGLDGSSLDLIMDTVSRLHESQMTVLIVEHNLDVVKGLADYIAFLDQGRVVAYGTPDEIFARKDLSDLYFGSTSG